MKFLVREASGGHLGKLFFPRKLSTDTDWDGISKPCKIWTYFGAISLDQHPAPPKFQNQQSRFIPRYSSSQDPLKSSVAGRWYATFGGQSFSEDVWFLGFPADLGMCYQTAILPQKGWPVHVLKMQLKSCCSKQNTALVLNYLLTKQSITNTEAPHSKSQLLACNRQMLQEESALLSSKKGFKPFYDSNFSQSKKRVWLLTLDWDRKTVRVFDKNQKTTQGSW